MEVDNVEAEVDNSHTLRGEAEDDRDLMASAERAELCQTWEVGDRNIRGVEDPASVRYGYFQQCACRNKQRRTG